MCSTDFLLVNDHTYSRVPLRPCKSISLETNIDIRLKIQSLVSGFFKFEVHRQVLMDKSLYFRAMLSAFREKDQPEVTLYSICDTLDTMRELVAKILTFIYFDK